METESFCFTLMKNIIHQRVSAYNFLEVLLSRCRPHITDAGDRRVPPELSQDAADRYSAIVSDWRLVEHDTATDILASYPNFYFPFGTLTEVVPEHQVLQGDGSKKPQPAAV